MKVAMLGHKGIPARSGGIQQSVEARSRLLTQRGHEVVVYCRRSYCGREASSSSDGKLHRVVMPSIPTKHLDAITHTFASTLDVIRRRVDVVHYHAIGPSSLAFLSRCGALPVLVSVHGLDWNRAKWGWFAKHCIRFGERLATVAATRMVVVSPVLHDYFTNRYGIPTEFIPNGVAPMPHRAPDKMLQFGIQPNRYVFAAARFVREKGLHYLIDAFRTVPHDVQLVIAGGGRLDNRYERELRRCEDPRVIFTGPADRKLMAELFSHARLFVLPSEIEGMSVVLLEAMHMGVPVLVSDIAENRCVVEDAGVTFRSGDVESLRQELHKMLDDTDLSANWSSKVVAKARPYSWSSSVDRYEQIYRECIGN
jgi:glycosyltransferase involved in cell wall biosynthesis